MVGLAVEGLVMGGSDAGARVGDFVAGAVVGDSVAGDTVGGMVVVPLSGTGSTMGDSVGCVAESSEWIILPDTGRRRRQ